jgi:hypothetical protein
MIRDFLTPSPFGSLMSVERFALDGLGDPPISMFGAPYTRELKLDGPKKL